MQRISAMTLPSFMSSRIPHLLQPFLHLPPEHSLYLISHVLGASANWLIIRYLCAALANDRTQRPPRGAYHDDVQLAGPTDLDRDNGDPIAVVLVSWMREYEFWKMEARRATVSCGRVHPQYQANVMCM